MQTRVVTFIKPTSSLVYKTARCTPYVRPLYGLVIKRESTSIGGTPLVGNRMFYTGKLLPIVQGSIKGITEQTKEKWVERQLKNFWEKKQGMILPFLKELTKGKFKPGGHCNVYNLVLALEIKRERIGDTVSLVMSMEEREGVFSSMKARMHSFVLINNRIIVDIAHRPYSAIKEEKHLLMGNESFILTQINPRFRREYTLKNTEDTNDLEETEAYAKKEKGYSELSLSNPHGGNYIPEKNLIKIVERFYGVKVTEESWLTWFLGKHITKTETWKRLFLKKFF